LEFQLVITGIGGCSGYWLVSLDISAFLQDLDIVQSCSVIAMQRCNAFFLQESGYR